MSSNFLKIVHQYDHKWYDKEKKAKFALRCVPDHLHVFQYLINSHTAMKKLNDLLGESEVQSFHDCVIGLTFSERIDDRGTFLMKNFSPKVWHLFHEYDNNFIINISDLPNILDSLSEQKEEKEVCEVDLTAINNLTKVLVKAKIIPENCVDLWKIDRGFVEFNIDINDINQEFLEPNTKKFRISNDQIKPLISWIEEIFPLPEPKEYICVFKLKKFLKKEYPKCIIFQDNSELTFFIDDDLISKERFDLFSRYSNNVIRRHEYQKIGSSNSMSISESPYGEPKDIEGYVRKADSLMFKIENNKAIKMYSDMWDLHHEVSFSS